MTIKAGDLLFLDTNVLLTATDRTRLGYGQAQRLLTLASCAGYHMGVSGQILREYLAVATRPVPVNGLGLSLADALANVETFAQRLVFYEENETVAKCLRRLVQESGVGGKRVHDVNVVATMLTHGILRLVTDNTADFAAFAGIECLTLAETGPGFAVLQT